MANVQEVETTHAAFVEEISNELRGKKRGYLKSLPVGAKIFPFAIPPRLEIQLLIPEDQTIQFRRISDPLSPAKKRGEWQIGKPADAVACIIDWAETMKKVAVQT